MTNKKPAPREQGAAGGIVECGKDLFFGADIGELNVIPYYANNELWYQELRFSVPASAWNEFESSQLFRDLTDYVRFLSKQTPEIHNSSPEIRFNQIREESASL